MGSAPSDMAAQLLQRMLQHAEEAPEAMALCELDGARRSMTYGDLTRFVATLADRLEGMSPQPPVVLISFANQLEFATALLGVFAAGGTAFPIHPRLTREERRTAARQSGAAAVIGTDHAANDLEAVGVRPVPGIDTLKSAFEPPREHAAGTFRSDAADSARLLLQSSGTTGSPKIVERRGPAVDAVARNVAESVHLRPKDRILGLVPACHSYGVETLVVGPIWAGACTYLCRGMDAVLKPHDAGLANLPPATVMPGVPAMFEMLAPASGFGGPVPPALGGLRCVYSAGATLPRAVYDAFERRFGLRIGQLYGMTEIGAVTFNDPDARDFDPANVGLPMRGVRVKVVDPETRRLDRPRPAAMEGEVAVSAPSMLSGYLRAEGSPAAGTSPWASPLDEDELAHGFFFTGDQGFLDERGRLTITGRLKLVVDVGGLKVNLLEVEKALRAHHAVDECVVTAVPVSETVSRLKAYILPANGGADLSFDEVRAFLRPRLSGYKIPRVFEIRDSFPRSPTGKLLRHKL